MFSFLGRVYPELVANIDAPLDQCALDGVALQLAQGHRLMVFDVFL